MIDRPLEQQHCACTVTKWDDEASSPCVRIIGNTVAFPDGTWIQFYCNCEASRMLLMAVKNLCEQCKARDAEAIRRCTECGVGLYDVESGPLCRECLFRKYNEEQNKRYGRDEKEAEGK